MALSKQSLSDRIYNHLTARWGLVDTIPLEGSEANNPDLSPSKNHRILADCIAEAVIDEITQNAVVQTIGGAPDGEHTGKVY